MAKNDIKILITARDKASKTFDKVEGRARRMAGGVKGAAAALAGPLAIAGGLAAAGLALTIKGAMDFETSFAGVRKTVNATEAEFQKLAKGFRDMSKEIPVSVNDLNRIGEAAGQLGIETDSILSFTRVMADLGVTTNLAADEAATQLARLANITGMSQDNFDELGSTIVALGNNLATTEAEIVQMGLRLAGAGKQVGLSEHQILSLAGALSSVGIEAQAGGTAFSRAFIKIANATRDTSEEGQVMLMRFADVAGMSSAAFAKAFEEDAAGAMVSFIEGLDKVSKSGENVFAVLDELELGEIRVRDALLRASGAGDLFRESLEIGSKAWAENTALTKEAEQRYATTASQMTILKNNVQDIFITIGQKFLPVLNTLIGVLKDKMPGAMVKVDEGFAKMGKWLKEHPEDIERLKKVAVAAFAGIMGSVRALGEMWDTNFLGMRTAAGLLADSIRALMDSVIWLHENWERLIGGIADTLLKIPGMTTLINTVAGQGGSPAGDFISRPGMGVQKFSPQDTIIGFKGEMPATMNATVNVTIMGNANEDDVRAGVRGGLDDVFVKVRTGRTTGGF